MFVNYAWTDKGTCSIVEQMQQTLDRHSLVSARLFPGRDVADLALLDREQLLQLALSDSSSSGTSAPAPPWAATSISDSPSNSTQATAVLVASPHHPHTSPDTIVALSTPSSLSRLHTSGGRSVNTLDTLEQAPELNTAADEITRRRSVINAVSDDVNGLSFSLDKTSSYVGVSSINAALKAIFKIAPQVQDHLQQNCPPTALPSRAPSSSSSPAPSQQSADDAGPFALPPPDVAEHYIDSYFDEIHAMMPMIDEDAFRHTFLYDERTDAPWLALFNVVLALGSLASGTCNSCEHLIYSKRARQILRQKSLGSNHLFILQAHGLLSGYYLHWLNRPNEAHAMMGATMRIASAVGIHREYDASATGSRAVIPPEIRRRTWWSLVCLDTWASMTTGRPSFGRLGPGITVKYPVLPLSKNNKQYLASLKLLPLVAQQGFCKIATRVQDLLATKPLLSLEELTTEDAALFKWHDELPPILRFVLPKTKTTGPPYTNDSKTPNASKGSSSTQPQAFEDGSCPVLLRTPRAIMHWWYLNLRILMHRPYLIAASLCRVPEASLSEQDVYAIRKCRMLAGQAIMTIDQTCQDSLIAGWNAVWLMYQAVMVPLISLSALYTSSKTTKNDAGAATTAAHDPNQDATEWEAQVQTAVGLFDRMSSYSLAAARSKAVVQQMLQACKDIHTANLNAAEPRQDPLPDGHGNMGGDFQPSLNDFNEGMPDFDLQDPDMGFLWDDMAWESTSNTFENVPFADAYMREFQDAFEM
jgi:hypothetical protein